PYDGSSFAAAVGVPPVADTRWIAAVLAPYRMTLSLFHVPPRPPGASHNTVGTPPAIGTFISLPPAKNPMYLPSGDQNGNDAPSVPARARLVTEPAGRIQT